MIFTDLSKINDLLPYMSLRIGKALAYLRDTNFADLPNGEYEVEGRDIFARVNTYETEPREEKKPESHIKYIDVQFLVSGKESIGFCPLTEEHKVVENYADKQDLLFYERAYNENYVNMKAGDIAIFFPWEIHRPGCNVGSEKAQVKKVVVKVRNGG